MACQLHGSVLHKLARLELGTKGTSTVMMIFINILVRLHLAGIQPDLRGICILLGARDQRKISRRYDIREI